MAVPDPYVNEGYVYIIGLISYTLSIIIDGIIFYHLVKSINHPLNVSSKSIKVSAVWRSTWLKRNVIMLNNTSRIINNNYKLNIN